MYQQYLVRHEANYDDPLNPKYKSYFMAYDADETWVGGISHIEAKETGGRELHIIIQEEWVKATSTIEACTKFREWMYKGLDKSFLQAPITQSDRVAAF